MNNKIAQIKIEEEKLSPNQTQQLNLTRLQVYKAVINYAQWILYGVMKK